MSVVALVIAPSISMNLDNNYTKNTNDKIIFDLDGANYAEGKITLVNNQNKTEFQSKVKYLVENNEIKSISLSMHTNLYKNQVSNEAGFVSSNKLDFYSNNIQLKKTSKEFFAKGDLIDENETVPVVFRFYLDGENIMGIIEIK